MAALWRAQASLTLWGDASCHRLHQHHHSHNMTPSSVALGIGAQETIDTFNEISSRVFCCLTTCNPCTATQSTTI
ncbi:hypothetical protein V8C35DRAFT_311786 [Trichoderma chlorosporum]